MVLLYDQFGREMNLAAVAKARRAMEVARRVDSLSAAYDAAATTVENAKHWRFADGLSASVANSATVRKTLRERSRYECLENNSFAKGIALTLANDTIATGPSLQCTLSDRNAGREIERRWRKWAKDVRLADKLRLARLAKVIDGETFILKGTNRRSKNDVKLDIRIIEADQISTPNYMEGMPNHVDGIQFDDWGTPIMYHMLESHPGDYHAWGAWTKRDIDPDDIIHLYRRERAGQYRGVPEMTTALPLFALLRRFTLAVILAAETAADFTAILKTQASAFDSSSDGVDDLEPFDFSQIDRGLMTSLPKGWELQQFKAEQPTTTYEMFRNAILNEVARCVHMPSNKARADSSSYNYSSGRLDHQTYYEAIAIERTTCWEIEALDRIFEWWLDEALLMDGYLPAIDPTDEIPHVWRWPPNRDVDPRDMAEANSLLIAKGLKTRAQYLHEQNIDPEEHAEQLAAEGWVNPDIPPAPASPVADLATDPSTANPSADAAADAAPAPTGEFRDLSRLQVMRLMRSVDDALSKVKSGEWTIPMARTFMSALSLSDAMISNLLAEFETADTSTTDV